MLGVSDIESTSLSRLLTSTIVAVVVVLFLSHSFSTYLIKPMTYDGTLVRSGRYSFVFEAWRLEEARFSKLRWMMDSSMHRWVWTESRDYSDSNIMNISFARSGKACHGK